MLVEEVVCLLPVLLVNICMQKRFVWWDIDLRQGRSRKEWLPEMVLIDTATELTRHSVSSVLCLWAETEVKQFDHFYLYIYIYMYVSFKWINEMHTIWPTQVVRIARKERIVPKKLSWRSVTEATPTPKSRTSRDSLIFWLHTLMFQNFVCVGE